jgi:hypothetical protein
MSGASYGGRNTSPGQPNYGGNFNPVGGSSSGAPGGSMTQLPGGGGAGGPAFGSGTAAPVPQYSSGYGAQQPITDYQAQGPGWSMDNAASLTNAQHLNDRQAMYRQAHPDQFNAQGNPLWQQGQAQRAALDAYNQAHAWHPGQVLGPGKPMMPPPDQLGIIGDPRAMMTTPDPLGITGDPRGMMLRPGAATRTMPTKPGQMGPYSPFNTGINGSRGRGLLGY